MNLDCVSGRAHGLSPTWVVIDRDTGCAWGASYIASEMAWVEAADRLGQAVEASGCEVGSHVIPTQRIMSQDNGK